MTNRVPWLRIVVEGVVIVSSILLAFGIQAWWDARGDASRRDAVLEGLRSDFEAARTDLDRVTPFHQRGLSGAAELMQLGEDGPIVGVDAARVDSLFAAAMGGASYDPPLGALEALITSGDLDLLGDPELTVYLVGFPALVTDLDREQRYMRELLLETHRHLASLGISSEIVLDDPYWDVPWRIGPGGVSAIAHSPGLRTWISALWTIYRNMTGLEQEIDARLALIEAKLAAID